MRDLTDEELLDLARTGDREAAGEYFARNQAVLLRAARALAVSPVDADDLLSDALLTLLERWRTGRGPEGDVNAYVYVSMRNRMRDELRSPRSRTAQIDDALDAVDTSSRRLHLVELAHETEMVRRAFRRLPPAHRTTLQAVVVEGRRARHLEDTLGRPASAIHSLTRRAKIALRRALLQEYLQEQAPRECRAATDQLPPLVQNDPHEMSRGRAVSHVLGCPRCLTAWAAFAESERHLGSSTALLLASLGTGGLAAAIAPAGGVAPDVVGTDAAIIPDAGSAADAGTVASGETAPETSRTKQTRGPHWTGTPQLALSLPWTRGASPVRSGLARGGRAATVNGVLLTVGLSSVVVGAVMVILGIVRTLQADPSPTATIAVENSVVESVAGAERAALDVSLRMDPDVPVTDAGVVLELPAGADAIGWPAGWDCSPEAVGLVCATPPGPVSGRLLVEVAGVAEGAQYRVLVSGEAGSWSVRGAVSGDLTVPGRQTATERAT